jgi:hypothetical protein
MEEETKEMNAKITEMRAKVSEVAQNRKENAKKAQLIFRIR